MKFYLIHHAHLDIGYTDRQEKIAWNHARYLESVVDILRRAEKDRAWKGFRWNVESFWMLECFLEDTDPEHEADFWRFAREGKIGISGNYLNGSDLMDDLVLRETLSRCKETAQAHGVTPVSAMTADINGYPWGYASALAGAGIRYLLSAVHTHHGYHAANRKQFPFFWKGPDGREVLVWQTEHYHFGNEINIHQLSGQYGYMIHDGLPNTGLSNEELSRRRLYGYASQLKKDGYPWDFCPILVSGLCTDNSPPGPAVIEFVHRWNALHGQDITLEMTTLDAFFAEVEKHRDEIPHYRGDWTDWWADGTCSTPDAVGLYKDAARRYHVCRRMDPDCLVRGSRELREQARKNLMLYAEHTWGFSSSVSEPAHPMVNTLEMRKAAMACNAHEAVSRWLDGILKEKGATAMVIWKDYRLHVINPNPVSILADARVDLEILFTHSRFRLVREDTGEEVAYQLSRVARGKQFHVPLRLEPKEHVVLRLVEMEPEDPPMPGMFCEYGADGVQDLAVCRLKDENWICTPQELKTDYIHVKWEMGKGITSIYDRKHGRELIEDMSETAFGPIYEVTPLRSNPLEERRRMGRNRKAPHTLRDRGRLMGVEVTDCGPVMLRVVLTYEMEGCRSTELILTAFRQIPGMNVELRMHKESRLEPENVYLALPFASEDAVFYADKMGCIFRPRVDQIPGTCTDYYETGNGVAWVRKEGSIVVEMPDAPMISMGTLLPHDIRLMGDEQQKNTDQVYAWVMNNFWETNFKATLGGHHQFTYRLRLMDEKDPEDIFDAVKAENTGFLSFPSFDVDL